MLQLITQLSLAPDPQLRQRVAEMLSLQPRPPEAEMRMALEPMALNLLRQASEVLATALGCTVRELLEFSRPGNTVAELAGRRAVKRRLDRIWGGPTMVSIEARQPVLLPWPGPSAGYAILLRGDAYLNHDRIVPHTPLRLQPGTVISLDPEALLLLRRPLVGSILDDMQAGGLAFESAIQQLCSAPVLEVASRLGRLALLHEEGRVRLQQRVVRLTPQEYRTLKALAAQPGATVSRQSLAAAAGAGNLRALDGVVLSLRNKLGDGLITTVYGQGYVLERATGPGAEA